ncbi:alpha/beta fold hydrolase [Agromyces intestinalis]|uniref:alpha/beta fold hydrolase n=1 Tax=Agromyces intestinalis TaxID=2592652 RepID=UPI00143D7F09|nr:alpha/beta hydrolase [Agromyces intestinalis]
MTLSDGRRLGYAQYGDPVGHPVFFFHGTQSSRLEHHPDDSIALARGVRIIAVDRPGHGLSDFQPDRHLLDWPEDVTALADALGIERFAVMGMSGGGPFALACASAIPGRLTTATIIAGMAPLADPTVFGNLTRQLKSTMWLARRAPRLVSAMLSMQRRQALTDPHKAVAPVIAQMSPNDRAIMARPEIAPIMPAMYAEAYRTSARGPAWDLTILTRPWGFALSEVSMPIILWQGEDDRNVPVAWGRYLEANLPHCTTHFIPDEGHLLIFDHFDEILAEAVG